jgi:hypothetical protein
MTATPGLRSTHLTLVVLNCRVLVTREIKEEGSLGLSDRLREGKGWTRPGLCDLLNGD